MWSKTCKVIDLSQKDSVEIKIEVSVKEANGDKCASYGGDDKYETIAKVKFIDLAPKGVMYE